MICSIFIILMVHIFTINRTKNHMFYHNCSFPAVPISWQEEGTCCTGTEEVDSCPPPVLTKLPAGQISTCKIYREGVMRKPKLYSSIMFVLSSCPIAYRWTHVRVHRWTHVRALRWALHY